MILRCVCSFGTSQALRTYCRLTPTIEGSNSSINGILLIGTKHFIPPTPSPIFYLPTFILDYLQPTLSEKFTEIAFDKSCSDSIKEKSRLQSNNNKMHVCKAFYRQMQWCNDEEIASVQCPVMIIQGRNDLITPLEGAQEMEQALKNCQLHIIDNAGHQVMQEKPEEVLELFSSFIRKFSPV
mgnify:CR=1 FL=1